MTLDWKELLGETESADAATVASYEQAAAVLTRALLQGAENEMPADVGRRLHAAASRFQSNPHEEG